MIFSCYRGWWLLVKRYIVVLCLVVLVGCEGKLANQAVKEAKLAFEEKSYQQAVGLLKLASDEVPIKSMKSGMSRVRPF